MEYKAIKKVIEEKITETYHLDGKEYKAQITTYGPYGVYGNMRYQGRQAVVEIEHMGRVRIIFHKDQMLLPSTQRPARFTKYAEAMIEKAVIKYLGFNKTLEDTEFTNRVMEFEIT